MSPTLQDWPQPETWHVGDKVTAALWTERVYEPLGLLLRRPLTIMRRTTNFTCTGNTGSQPLSFDTVDIDDDGMVITTTPTDTIYAQRSGVYGISFAATLTGNTQTGNAIGVRVAVNGTNMATRQSPAIGTGSGIDEFKALSVDLTLNEGDAIQLMVNNFLTNTVTIVATLNAPRVACMWKRPP